MLGLGALPILLVFMQPDLGTALVYSAALFAVLFFVGVRWRQLLVLAAVGLLAITSVLWWLPAAGVQVLKPYQAARLTLDPSADPSGITYNLSQSITAVGSGGLTGRGVVGASQTRLDYLPEHATDFAFASLAEQRGFVGCSILLLLYLLVVWRGLRVITGASDLYGVVVAGGLVVGFLFQVFVNVGHDDGRGAGHRHPAPFVTVGGLVDGREPRSHRRAAEHPLARRAGRARSRVRLADVARSPARRAASASRCATRHRSERGGPDRRERHARGAAREGAGRRR